MLFLFLSISLVSIYIGVEINWGIRFSTVQNAEGFWLHLCREVESRMMEVRVKCCTVTVKLRRRSAGASINPSKYLGCGRCDCFSKSATSKVAMWTAGQLQPHCLRLFRELCVQYKVIVEDIRGVGVQVSRLQSRSGCSLADGGNGQQQVLFKASAGTVTGTSASASASALIKENRISFQVAGSGLHSSNFSSKLHQALHPLSPLASFAKAQDTEVEAVVESEEESGSVCDFTLSQKVFIQSLKQEEADASHSGDRSSLVDDAIAQITLHNKTINGNTSAGSSSSITNSSNRFASRAGAVGEKRSAVQQDAQQLSVRSKKKTKIFNSTTFNTSLSTGSVQTVSSRNNNSSTSHHNGHNHSNKQKMTVDIGFKIQGLAPTVRGALGLGDMLTHFEAEKEKERVQDYQLLVKYGTNMCGSDRSSLARPSNRKGVVFALDSLSPAASAANDGDSGSCVNNSDVDNWPSGSGNNVDINIKNSSSSSGSSHLPPTYDADGACDSLDSVLLELSRFPLMIDAFFRDPFKFLMDNMGVLSISQYLALMTHASAGQGQFPSSASPITYSWTVAPICQIHRSCFNFLIAIGTDATAEPSIATSAELTVLLLAYGLFRLHSAGCISTDICVYIRALRSARDRLAMSNSNANGINWSALLDDVDSRLIEQFTNIYHAKLHMDN